MNHLIEEQNQSYSNTFISIGRSELFWKYYPYAGELLMYSLRKVGERWMIWKGFQKITMYTEDGQYNLWKKQVQGTKPIVFFPGFGLGAIPYVESGLWFNRTIIFVEVPNIGYASEQLSDRHATGATLFTVIKKYIKDDDHDVIAHSLGGAHAGMYLNTQKQRGFISTNNMIMCDVYVNPVDCVSSQLGAFLGFDTQHALMNGSKVHFLKYLTFVWCVTYSLEFTSFAKRYNLPEEVCLWDDYKGVQVKYIYGENDFLYDVSYISKQMDEKDCYVIPRGHHGSCFFGKKREHTLNKIKRWLSSNPSFEST